MPWIYVDNEVWVWFPDKSDPFADPGTPPIGRPGTFEIEDPPIGDPGIWDDSTGKDPTGPPSGSEDEIVFAVRFSRCDSRRVITCETCWNKDRSWMTAEEGKRFEMHKEHKRCHCWVKFFTFTEFRDWIALHGTEEA